MTAKPKPPRVEVHKWDFKARFRRNAFGWKSQPAVTRVKEAVAEIKAVAKVDPVLAAEGAVVFLERVSPAIEHVDGSSGSMSAAVNKAIRDLWPLIANAPVDTEKREAWLERLFAAHEADEMPYIEELTDHWGALCGSKEVASKWAEKLLGLTRLALGPDTSTRHYFHGSSACLAALYHAERYEEIIELLTVRTIWSFQQWAVRAMAASGDADRALDCAESCRGLDADDWEVDIACEEILLAAGRHHEAYARYGVGANQTGTCLATFRTVKKKYPHVAPAEVLADLVRSTPGDEGQWFSAAKDAGLYADAIALVSQSPCDPKTLTRAARDYIQKQPAFAVEAGLLAVYWMVRNAGYSISSADVWEAYRSTLAAAEQLGDAVEVKDRVRAVVAAEGPGDDFVTRMIGRELGL